MRILDAKKAIEKLANIPFKEYINNEQYNNIILNKGKTGQILELTLGLPLSNATLDFEDGELKTNKCDRNGHPVETMFITQISSIIDDLLACKPFTESKLYKKTKNMLYVRISKEGSPENWMYLTPILVDLSSVQYRVLLEQLETDYYDICGILNDQICSSPDNMLHTANGQFIQIRTKDSTPYTPIYSKTYNRIISDKNRAFYFKKEGLNYIISVNN